MTDYKRSQRVGEVLRHEISQIITQELKDPLIGITTITAIKLTEDLKLAKIYVSILGSKEIREKGLQGLERAKSWIRSELGHRIDLKFIPELKFFYDETLDYAQNIEALIKRAHEQ